LVYSVSDRPVKASESGCEARREITANAIKKEKPFAVYVATGSKPILPGIDGINNKNVCVVQTP